MSFITPNTDLIILYDVPLDQTYEHTLYFDNPTQQATYFQSKVRWTFNELTYQRVQRGYVRVEKNAEDLYNCNYMMFRNTAFGSKWFYAFITGVEFISNTVSQVQFEMDFMQTWFFDFTLNSCFIERQHTETDNLGEHHEPEPVAIGEYVLNNYNAIGDNWYRELCTLVAVVIQNTGGSPQGEKYQGIYSGTQLYVFYDLPTVSMESQIETFLSAFVSTPENVVGMYVCPRKFVGENLQSGTLVNTFRQGCFHEQISFSQMQSTDTLDGYLPRNRKLYTYPYNFLHVDNGSSGELSLRYEFFPNNEPTVEINASYLEPVEALLEPANYKGVSGAGSNNVYHAESIPLTDFPVCSWSFDSYLQWKNTQAVAKSIRYVGKQARTAVNGGIAMSGQFRGERNKTALSTVNNLIGNAIDYSTDYMASGYLASVETDICKGSTSNGNILTMRGLHAFYQGRCSVNRQSAEMIDTFFDKYGYAINKVDTPNLKARAKWTYVKTRDCTAVGSVPSVDMKAICNIFDKGITFWVNASEVGRYDLADQNTAPLD